MNRVPNVLVVDSVTAAGADASGVVLVTGSHGGETAALFALAAGAKAFVANDAGVGRDEAGIAGLAVLDEYGAAGLTVGAMTARIGDGEDTWASGLVSHANARARELGVEPGMTVAEAAGQLAGAPPLTGPRPQTPADRSVLRFEQGGPTLVGLDSASQIGPEHAGLVVVTGSHGGAVNGRAVKAPVAAAVFNDAGVGKDRAGIGRLPILDRDGICGLAVAHTSARIGDARDTYERGEISHVNTTAAAFGVRPGMAARDAVQRVAAAAKEVRCQS